MTKRRRKPGAIILVPLEEGRWGYARALTGPLMEFYDGVTTSDAPASNEALRDMKVVFRIDVMDSAVTSGRWKVIGQMDLTEEEEQHVERFFKQDPLSGKLSIYWEEPGDNQPHECPASLEDCLPLERASVWSANHVEDRLRDYHAGVPNKWVRPPQSKE